MNIINETLFEPNLWELNYKFRNDETFLNVWFVYFLCALENLFPEHHCNFKARHLTTCCVSCYQTFVKEMLIIKQRLRENFQVMSYQKL